MGDQDTREYLTRMEVAVLLRTCDQTVDKRIREGQIHAVRVGRRVLIPRDSLDAYLHRCGIEPRATPDREPHHSYAEAGTA